MNEPLDPVKVMKNAKPTDPNGIGVDNKTMTVFIRGRKTLDLHESVVSVSVDHFLFVAAAILQQVAPALGAMRQELQKKQPPQET